MEDRPSPSDEGLATLKPSPEQTQMVREALAEHLAKGETLSYEEVLAFAVNRTAQWTKTKSA